MVKFELNKTKTTVGAIVRDTAIVTMFHIISKMPRRSALHLCLVFLMLLVIATTAFAAGGDIVWQSADTQSGKQQASASTIDSQGNVIIAGYRNLTGNTNDDYYTVKFKADGSGVLWSAVYDKTGGSDQINDVTVDSNNDVVVTGTIWNGVNLDIHTVKYCGTTGSSSCGGKNGGDVLWEQTFNGAADGNDSGTVIAVDPSNDIYVGGYSQNSSGKEDYLLIKYPSAGGPPAWQTRYSGPAGYPGTNKIAALATGASGVAVTGQSWNGTVFECATIKYDLQGNQLWPQAKRYTDGPYTASGKVVNLDASGNVIVAASASNGLDLDIYTVKYAAADGTQIWASTFDGREGDEPKGMVVATDGSVYITGYSSTQTGHYDFYTTKLDGANGNTLWRNIFDSGNGNTDITAESDAIALDPSGAAVFVTGYTITGGISSFETLKYKSDNGNVIWQRLFNGTTGKNSRPIGLGLSTTGDVLVAGWADTAASNLDFVAIKYDRGALNQPTGLTAQTLSSTSIKLSWSNNSANEDGFSIERCTLFNCSNFTELTTVGQGIATYTDTALDMNSYYSYRVRAYNSVNGNSQYSNTVQSFTTSASVVPPVWSYTYNSLGNSDDYAAAIAVGPDKNPVVTGASHDFFPGYTSGDLSWDYLAIKLDRNTNAPIWSERYNDPGNASDVATCVAVDSTNIATVSGYATLNVNSADINSLFTIRYNAAPASPQALTADQYNGPGATDDRAVAIATAVDATNNITVVGYGKNSAGNDDIYLLKYAANGTRVWDTAPFDNGGDDFPSAVGFAPDNSIYVSGYSEKNPHTNPKTYNFYTARYNGANGNLIWNDIYSAPAALDNKANGLAIDANGDLYVTGYATNASGNNDFYTIKYKGANATAQRLWERAADGPGHGDDKAIGVRIDQIDGNISVAGTSKSQAADMDYRVVRYTPAGDVLWDKSYQKPGSDEDANAMSIDSNGTIYVTGNTYNGPTLDSLTVAFNYLQGDVAGATVYNGSANNSDDTEAITINSYDEVFAAGYTTKGDSTTDLLVYKIVPVIPSAPSPLIGSTPTINTATLVWPDTPADKDGYTLQRQLGACSSANLNPWGFAIPLAASAATYTDINLVPGTSYCYRIQSFRNSDSTTSRWNQVTVTPAIATAPSGLTASTINTTQINLSWADNTSGETGFRVERCTGSSCGAGDFAQVGSIRPSNTTSYNDIDAVYGTVYKYRVIAVGTGWESAPSDSYTALVTATPSTPVLGAPTRVSEAQINLSWTDAANSDESGYKVYRCTGSGCTPTVQIGSTLAANTFSYNDTTAIPGATHVYRVSAFKTATNGWEKVSASSADTVATLLGPGTLTTVVNSTTKITLTWNDRTSTETGFKIERCSGSSCTDFSQIATVGVNITTYADLSVTEGTTYRYQVRAYNGTAWDSPYSPIASAATSAAGTPVLAAPTRVSEVQINLSWTDATNSDESGYKIYRCIGSGCTPTVQIGSNLAPNTFSYSNTGLIPGTTYVYRVSAFKTAANGWEKVSASSPDTVATILEPNNFTATANNNTTQVTLGWTDRTASETGFEIWYCANPPCTSTLLATVTANSISYTDTSACNGTPYLYEIKAINSTVPWYSAVTSLGSPVTTLLPTAPATFTATQLSESSIKLDWNDPNIDESGYKVERCSGDSTYCSADEARFTVTYTLAANTISYTNTGLAPNSTYTYRVRAYKSATCAWSMVSGIRTVSTTVPAPTSLALQTLSSTGIKLTWTNTTNSETGFVVERCSGVGCSDFSALSASSSISPQVTTFTDSSACSGISYSYRIKSKNAGLGWESGYSNLATISTPHPSATYPNLLIDPNFEDAASGWSAAPTGGSSAGASIDSAFFYNGSRSLKIVGDSGSAMGRSQVIPVASGQQYVLSGYIRSGLTSGSATCNVYGTGITSDPGFTIAANDPRNNSWVNLNEVVTIPVGTTSITVQCFTTAGSVGTVSVDGLSFSKAFLTVTPSTVNESRILLSWPDIATDETGYTILKCSGAVCSQIGQVAANVLTYTDTGLTPPGTSFNYQVQTYKTATCGWTFPDSSVVTGTTAATPPAPTGLGATANNTTQITLSWTNNTSSETGIVVERCQQGLDCPTYSALTTTGSGINSYVDTSLVQGTTYQYQVKAVNSTLPWASAYSASVTRATLPPAAPVLAVPTAVSDTRIDLSWTDPNSDETNYLVLRDNVVIATRPANSTSYSDNAVTAGNSYTYMIRGTKTAANSWTIDSNSRTAAPSTPAPSGLSAAIAGSTQLNLTWSNSTSTETEVRVERCQNAGCSTFSQIAVIPKAQPDTSYIDSSVVPGVTYRYQVRAASTTLGWTSAYSNIVTATPTALTVTATPTATRVSEVQINLSWNSVAGVSGYNVYYCSGSGCTPATLAGSVSGAATITYQHPGLAVNTYYRYLIKSYKSGTTGCTDSTTCQSAPSTASANLLTSLNAPTGLTATAINSTSVKLQWTNNTTSETGFVVERCSPSGSCTFAPITNTAVPHDTSWTDTTVAKTTGYQYRIKAANAAWTTSATPGFTAYSNTATATTPDAGPPYPVSAAQGTNKVTLTWGDNCSAGTQEEGFNLLRCTGSGCDPATDPSKIVMPFPGASSASSVTKTDTAVCSNQEYVYKVQAYNNTNHLCDFPSSTLAVITATPANAVLTVTSASEVKLSLAWTDTTLDTASYDIYRCVGNSCADFVKIGSKSGTPLTYDDTTVLPGTTYTYYVKGNGTAVSGCTAWSTSSNSFSQVANIHVPASFTANTVNMNRIDLAWTDTDTTTTGWKIERCFGDGCTDFAEIASLATKTPVSYSDTTVAAGISYRYRIRATGSTTFSGNTYYWVSDYSSVATAATALPVAPSSLNATMISSSQINLAWTPSSTADLNGYSIERCKGVGCMDFSQLTTVTPYTAVSFANTGIDPSTTYRYRVRGYKTAGGTFTDYSNIAEAVTLMEAPGSLTATAIGSHAVKLAWNQIFLGQDSVAIMVQIWNGEWVQLANVDGATSEYIDISGVSPLSTYIYQVRAFRGNLFADSNLATVTIPAYSPSDSSICVAGPLPNQPQITSAPATVATEGVAYSYNVTATAMGTGNSIASYTLAVKPNGMSINASTGAIAWTPDYTQSGNTTVTVRVADSLGVTAIQSFVIAVANDAQLPRITSSAITTCSGVTCTVGQTYRYQVLANNPEGNPLTYSLPTAPAGMTISSSGLITWTAQSGTNNVTVAVSNGTKTLNQTFSIPVTTYHPLAITSAPNTSAVNGAAYSYQLAITNADNYPLSYSLTAAPAGMTISSGGMVTWVPTFEQSGDKAVTIQVSDGSAAPPVSQSYTVTVSQYNIPAITAIPSQTASEGVLLSYQVAATAPLGGPYTYSLTGAPVGMGISSTGLITWTPATGQGANGLSVTVRVQAGIIAANNSTQSFTLNASFISSDPGATPRASVGVAYSYTAASISTGCTGTCTPISYSLINTGATPKPTGMTIVAATGAITWTPTSGQTGYNPVTVKATFGSSGKYATQAFNIAVPSINTITGTTAAVASPYNTTVTAVDPAGGVFTYSLTSPPSGMTIDPATGIISWTPAANQSGDIPVTVKATVNGTTPAVYAVKSFTIAVVSINSTAATTATVNSAYSYQVTATGTPVIPYVYSLDTKPALMNINSATGAITWIPDAVASSVPVTVRVTAADGYFVTQSFNLTSAPYINTPPITTAAVAQQYTGANATVTAGPSGTFTYSLTSPPAGMTIDPSTGVITWSPAANQTDNVPVTVTATVGGVTGSKTFNIAVLSITGSTTMTPAGAGALYNYQVTTTGTPAAYSLDVKPAWMSIDPATGVISGTPATLASNVPVTVRVTTAGGYFVTQAFTINVIVAVTHTTKTFVYTGAMETYSIPAGATNIQFSVKGAGGGGGRSSVVGTSGDYQLKSYSNAAAFSLNIYVAQGGQLANNESGGSGGWGYVSGGNGGDGDAYDNGCGWDWAEGGSGGGGASAVTLTSGGILLVEAAGGSGGGSDDWDGDCDYYYGGAGGSGGGANVPTPPTSPNNGSPGGNVATSGTNGEIVVTYDH